MPSFAEFGLAAPILQALSAEGYARPTPIQSQAIPEILHGRDLCGIAQTGTGKTAAFALPILQRLLAAPGRKTPRACRVLVLAPTRELASQIAGRFRAYGRLLPLSTAIAFGGVPIGPQQRQLAPGVDVLVATPGRLLDLIERKALVLSSVQILVLDEADRMLDLGFIHALRQIVKLLPRRRQTLLFSATMPKAIARLAEDYLDNPANVAVAPAATTAERVEQRVIAVPSADKPALLATLLRDPALDRVLVFTRTKHGADRLVRHLDKAGLDAAAIHGNKSQPQRERALAGFRAGRTRVLVATDIAARGIDVEGVSHVINFELPNVPEDYVHRIGRTARAGAAGTAIAFCCEEERAHLRAIEKLTRRPLRPLPSIEPSRSDGVVRPGRPAHGASGPSEVPGSPSPPDRSGIGAQVRAHGPGGRAGAVGLPAFLTREGAARRRTQGFEGRRAAGSPGSGARSARS